MPPGLQIASIIVWTAVGMTASGWVAMVAIDYPSGSCHGFQDCSARASFLNNAFWLFFAVGALLDGTERLMRWRRRRDQ